MKIRTNKYFDEAVNNGISYMQEQIARIRIFLNTVFSKQVFHIYAVEKSEN